MDLNRIHGMIHGYSGFVRAAEGGFQSQLRTFVGALDLTNPLTRDAAKDYACAVGCEPLSHDESVQ